MIDNPAIGPGDTLCIASVLTTSILGSSLSLLLAFILYRVKRWSQFNVFIYIMSICDFVFYCFYFIFAVGVSYPSVQNETIFLVLQLVSLVAESISYASSSIMSFANTYLLYEGQIFKHNKWTHVYAAVIILTIISWLPMTIYAIAKSPADIYLYNFGFDIALYIPAFYSIINIILSLTQFYKVKRMDINATTAPAIYVLVNRLKWYPTCQVLSRIFAIWLTSFPNWLNRPKSLSDSYYMSIYVLHNLGLLVTPIGFLLIYLRLRPINWRALFYLEDGPVQLKQPSTRLAIETSSPLGETLINSSSYDLSQWSDSISSSNKGISEKNDDELYDLIYNSVSGSSPSSNDL